MEFLTRIYSTLTENHQLFLMCLVIFVFTFGGGAILLTVPIIAEKIVRNVMVVGLIMGFPAFISMLSSIPAGSLSDSLGRKKILWAGFAVMIIFSLLISVANTLTLFLLAMLFMGLGNAIVNTASRAFIMDIAPGTSTSKYFGFFNTSASLGWAVGPLVSGALLFGGFSQGVYYVAYLFSFTCLLAGFITVFIKETVKETKSIAEGFRLLFKERFYIKGFHEYSKLRLAGGIILALTLLFTFLDRIIWTFEPLYYSEGIDSFTVGLILTMFILPYILFEIPSGFLADKYGKFKTLLSGLLLTGISLIVFGSTKQSMLLLASAFFSTVGLALAWPSISGLLSDVSAKHERGRIVGVWNTSEGLGFTLGPIIGGLIAGYYKSISMPFAIMGIVFILSVVVIALTSKKQSE